MDRFVVHFDRFGCLGVDEWLEEDEKNQKTQNDRFVSLSEEELNQVLDKMIVGSRRATSCDRSENVFRRFSTNKYRWKLNNFESFSLNCYLLAFQDCGVIKMFVVFQLKAH